MDSVLASAALLFGAVWFVSFVSFTVGGCHEIVEDRSNRLAFGRSRARPGSGVNPGSAATVPQPAAFAHVAKNGAATNARGLLHRRHS